MTRTHLSHLECPRCGERHDAHRPRNLCTCGSPLLARYDLDAVGKSVQPADFARRGADLWRYRELLPVGAGPDEEVVALNTGSGLKYPELAD